MPADRALALPFPIRAARRFGAAPATRDAWRELAEADASGLVSQTPEWIDVLCRAGYEDASRLYETADGRRMLLPLARRCGGIPRALAPLASLPASWGMGGLLCEQPPAAGDVARVVDDLRGLSAVQVIVRPNPLHASQWAQATRGTPAISLPRRAHVLDLAGGPDAVWDTRFSSSARRAVRKATAAGVEIRRGSDPRLLSDFRTLFELSVRRWAEAQHEPPALAKLRAYRRDPPAKFLHVAEALPHRLRVLIAYHDGWPVAGVIVLLGANASYTRGAMDKRWGALRANELLHWHAINEACDAGCRHYHLGETGASASLARFKEKLGARPVAYAEYRFERLPITRSQALARTAVKCTIGFRDA